MKSKMNNNPKLLWHLEINNTLPQIIMAVLDSATKKNHKLTIQRLS